MVRITVVGRASYKGLGGWGGDTMVVLLKVEVRVLEKDAGVEETRTTTKLVNGWRDGGEMLERTTKIPKLSKKIRPKL